MDSSAATKELVKKYYDGLSRKAEWGIFCPTTSY